MVTQRYSIPVITIKHPRKQQQQHNQHTAVLYFKYVFAVYASMIDMFAISYHYV